MAYEEKRAWIMLVVAVLGYGGYLVAVLARAGDVPLAETPYAAALLWSVGAAIVAGIVLGIGAGLASHKGARTDERDREIGRFGEYVGQSFVVIGSLAALLLAILEVGHFWIANVVYLCFVLSAILGSTAKIVAYRRGVPRW